MDRHGHEAGSSYGSVDEDGLVLAEAEQAVARWVSFPFSIVYSLLTCPRSRPSTGYTDHSDQL